MTDHLYHHKQQVFTTKAIYRELHRPASSLDNAPVANDHSTTVLFNDLVQLVLGNTQLDSNAIMLQINQSLTLRRQYIRLLKTLAFANSPVQAAASSTMTQISKRNSAEFELLFKPDKQFPGQVYVVLNIAHATEKHHNQGVRLNCCSDNLISSIHFPPIEDGKTQLLMEESDQKFINMFDPEFAIYLS